MQLQPGQLITAPFLLSAEEFKKFELRSGYALLEVVLHDGGQILKALHITPDQLKQIEILDHGYRSFLRSHRKYLPLHNLPVLSTACLRRSKVDMLTHHNETAYHLLLNLHRCSLILGEDLPACAIAAMKGIGLEAITDIKTALERVRQAEEQLRSVMREIGYLEEN
jgi:hypothetical protein